MNTLSISPTAAHPRSAIRISLALFALILVGAISASGILTSCASVQGTKADYFGYRNTIPTPAPEVEQEVSQQAWTNPMQSGVASSVAFVPVVTPWYDSWSMFARPSARFYGAYDSFGWNSPWGYSGNPYYGGWGGSAFGFNSFYDPFWGCNSSFMFYSSPWQRYNPYFGGYTPFGFYRPLGYWGSQNFTSYNNNLNTAQYVGNNGGNDVYSPSRMRDMGTQRAYGSNNAATYIGGNPANNSTYIGNYTSTGSGGAFSRGQGTGTEYKQYNPNNRASQYNTSSIGNGGNAVSNYTNYYGGGATKANGYTGNETTTRYYSNPPTTSGGRSYSGYGSFGGSSGGSSSGGWSKSSSGGYSTGSTSGGGHSSTPSSSGGSSRSSNGSSGGGARSRGGN